MDKAGPLRYFRKRNWRINASPLWALLCVLMLLLAITISSLQAPYPNPLRPVSERGFLDSLLYPIEINATRRLPVAPGRMNGVVIHSDAQRIWTVGTGGAILATIDGGLTWSAQTSGVQNDLNSVTFNRDGKRGWSVADNGLILNTINGGAVWDVQSSGVQADLYSLNFSADGKSGWAVGQGGTIVATNDGGRTWSTQISREQADLVWVHFNADGKRGWIVGAAGVILATSDGGLSWASRRSSVRAHLNSVHISDDGQQGWAVGSGGTILGTTDGGITWTPQTSGVQADLFSVQFNADSLRGWAVGGDGTIVATRDGGRTWFTQLSGFRGDLLSVQFNTNGLHGWAVGGYGTILATSDGGRNWFAQATGVRASLSSMHFSRNGQLGWAAGNFGSILATFDSGNSWSPQSSGVLADLNSLHFSSDGERGWVVGDKGTILFTNDRGQNWIAQASGVSVELLSVHFNEDKMRGWVVGAKGTILATTDGGLTWVKQRNDISADLFSVQFMSDGRRGWAVGANSIILTTSDGGLNWVISIGGLTWKISDGRSILASRVSNRTYLYSVHFKSDGLKGWAVGDAGTILLSRNGGISWATQPSNVQARLLSVAFSGDGKRGWIVGTGGTILSTVDGGDSWHTIVAESIGSIRSAVAVADASGLNVWAIGYPPALLNTSNGGRNWSTKPWPYYYSRYPAPWFWLSLVFIAFCWRHSFRLAPVAFEKGAEAIAATDSPTMDFTHDRLNFGPLAKGISRFLRNASTEPPLTLAISGDWGSGKSSLMRLICSDLRRHGSRPVWFNAWHHQKDEHLLAALLNAIRSQALPSSMTPDGWVFRLRLLWLRSKKHFLLAFVTVVAVTAVTSFLMTHDTDAWRKLWLKLIEHWPWIDAASKGEVESLSTADLGKLSAQLLSGITVLVALRGAMTAFGTDPAVLLSATAEQFRLKDASALTGFRDRFALQFDEVTKCLPYRMVIVIDDLDRCRPEAVLEVMEAVNFLVSSGSCFVIFGMATSRVQAALAVSFEKIASESVDLSIGINETPTTVDKERMERERRRNYARDYMEKLVNLEIVVPTSNSLEPHLLLEPLPGISGASRTAVSSVARLWPLALFAAAIFSGWVLGARWQFAESPGEPVSQQGVLTPTNESSQTEVNSSDTDESVSAVARSRYPAPVMQLGDERDISIYAFGLPILLLVSWCIVFALFRLRSNLYQVKDSETFRNSLRTWMPLVQKHRRTPRSLKRFGNRIRYLAMLQQGERLDKSRLDELTARFAAWWQRLTMLGLAPTGVEAVVRGNESEAAIGEDSIVALGALNEVFGSNWRNCIVSEFPSGMDDSLHKAIDLHRNQSANHWPPTSAELDRFEKTLKGIRVPSE